jgi:SNF family Na+-dependent transporter
MALFLIGIPLLILEISLGQYYQTGKKLIFIVYKLLENISVPHMIYFIVLLATLQAMWVCLDPSTDVGVGSV